jgi:DNA (cytosine-5)-methyltransferase 1
MQQGQKTKQMKEKPKVISLFSGAGGMDIGFEKAGFDIAVAVEFDPSCCDTLRKNRPKTPVIEGDISKLKTSHILEVGRLKVLEAGAVIGGPPCQSFSLAGKRLGMDEPRGRLVLEFIRIVRETLPLTFVMENVKGMANWNKGEALRAIEDALKEPIFYKGENYEYKIQHKILNAVNYGVPQQRERIFLIGNRVNRDFIFPEPTHGVREKQGDLFEKSLKDITTVNDAISDLPKADEPSDMAKRVSQTIKGRIKKHGY